MSLLLTDDFSTSTIGAAAEWIQDQGSTAAITGGVLKMTSGGPSVLRRNDPLVADLGDCRLHVKVNRKAGGTTPAPGVVLKQLDTDDFLHCRVQATGTLQIYKSVANVLTQLSTVGITALAQNTDYWIVGEIQGNDVQAEIWTTNPLLGGAATATRTHTLTGGDATAFGTGVLGDVGVRLSGADAAWEYDDFAVSDFVSDAPPGAAATREIGASRGIWNPGTFAVGR